MLLAGDLIRPSRDYAEASSFDEQRGVQEFAFRMHASDIGVVINPLDRGGYVLTLMRGQLVLVSQYALRKYE
jgi:hypothetical protein